MAERIAAEEEKKRKRAEKFGIKPAAETAEIEPVSLIIMVTSAVLIMILNRKQRRQKYR
jgi:hypothetical protein